MTPQPSSEATPHGENAPRRGAWRKKLYEIIFEADTPAGQLFDVALLIAIVISVVCTCLETVEELKEHKPLFNSIEWVVTILFSIEYVLRIICVQRPLRYMTSFFGIVDFLAVSPAYVGLLLTSAPSFAVVRSLRLLRAFRVFKLAWLTSEADDLRRAVWKSRAKIVVFLATVLIAVTIAGSAMYAIEHDPEDEDEQFTSIPQSMYWAIVTMTTVGYGDVVPHTPLGKLVSALLILLGYSLIIVPTGFVSAEIASVKFKQVTTRTCSHCMTEGHDRSAKFCKDCGERF